MFGSVKVRTSGLTRRARFRRWLNESPVTFYLSLAFIGLLLAGIVFVMLPASWFRSDTDNAGSPAQPAADVVNPARCAEQAPVAVTDTLFIPAWQMIGTTPTPYSTTGGPVLTQTPRQCFAHSVEGATYAAANLLAELSSVENTDLRQQIIRDRFSHTGNYDKMLAAAGKPFTAPTIKIQFVGYQITNQTDEVVQLDLATRPINGPSAGVVSAVSFTMVWEHNDWLATVPPATGFPLRSLSDFTGFTPWGQAG